LVKCLIQDPLPLRKAKITLEAAVKKAEKATKAAEEAQAVAEASLSEAEAYLHELSSRGGSGKGAIWWMERELVEVNFLLDSDFSNFFNFLLRHASLCLKRKEELRNKNYNKTAFIRFKKKIIHEFKLKLADDVIETTVKWSVVVVAVLVLLGVVVARKSKVNVHKTAFVLKHVAKIRRHQKKLRRRKILKRANRIKLKN
jgi:hypothetical protein